MCLVSLSIFIGVIGVGTFCIKAKLFNKYFSQDFDLFKKEEVLILTENLDKLKDVGLVLEPSGMNSFFIREIPTWIKLDNSDIMIEKIIYYLFYVNVVFNLCNFKNNP